MDRRFAGYRLAALPTEDISDKLREAAAVLEANATPMPDYIDQVPVKDSIFDVHMHAFPATGFADEPGRNIGNPGEIQRVINAQPPGGLELGWGPGLNIDRAMRQQGIDPDIPSAETEQFLEDLNEGRTYEPKGDVERFRIARAAQQKFKNILEDIPDGTIVYNAPVGALNEDFTRADAYMHQGFGPVQADGSQFGLMKGGQIEPLSPFQVMLSHAEHLATRARAANQPEIADAISAEIANRLNVRAATERPAVPTRPTTRRPVAPSSSEKNFKSGRQQNTIRATPPSNSTRPIISPEISSTFDPIYDSPGRWPGADPNVSAFQHHVVNRATSPEDYRAREMQYRLDWNYGAGAAARNRRAEVFGYDPNAPSQGPIEREVLYRRGELPESAYGPAENMQEIRAALNLLTDQSEEILF